MIGLEDGPIRGEYLNFLVELADICCLRGFSVECLARTGEYLNFLISLTCLTCFISLTVSLYLGSVGEY